MRLGDSGTREIDVISSGSIALDVALGIGGYPKGRIIEIYGPESSGKTTFALHAIAEAQKAGGKAAFIDAGKLFWIHSMLQDLVLILMNFYFLNLIMVNRL